MVSLREVVNAAEADVNRNMNSCRFLIEACVSSERVMPYFAQEPFSYLTLPTIKNAYKAFSLKINFRPDNVDGKQVEHSYSICAFVQYIISRSCFSLRFLVMCNVTASSVLSLPPASSSHHWWEGLILYAGEFEIPRSSSLMLAVLLFGCVRLSHYASSSEFI